MNENISFLIALGLIFFAVKYIFSGGSSQSSQTTTRRRNVPQIQVDQVKAMFPHVSESAIRWDLGLTGSVQITCDKILTGANLPEPPAGFFGESGAASNNVSIDSAASVIQPSSSSVKPSSTQTLITRLGLTEQAAKQDSDFAAVSRGSRDPAFIEDTSKLDLKDKKARMVLDARWKLMERDLASRHTMR